MQVHNKSTFMEGETGGEGSGAGSGEESAGAGQAGSEGQEGAAAEPVVPPEAASKIAKLEADLQHSQSQETVAKRYVAQLAQKLNENAAPAQPDAGDELERFKEEFEKDPQAALDKHLQDRMGPALQNLHQDAAAREVGAAKQRDPDLWTKYGPEIEKFMEPMSLETRSKGASWDDAAKFIKARHFDEEVEEAVKKRLDQAKDEHGVSFFESSSGVGNGGSSASPRLSPVEADIAKNFGMTAEEWTKFKGVGADGEVE